MTEQTEQNPEVLQDLPAGADPGSHVAPPDVATPGPPHGPDESAAVDAGAADEAEKADQADHDHDHGFMVPDVAPAPDSSAPVLEEPRAEAAASQPAAETAGQPDVPGDAEAESSEPTMRVKSGKPARPKSASPKVRKAAAAPAVVSDVPKSENMNWYILKVQSNREESIRESLLRRVSIQGLDRYFSEVIVPTEKVTEFKSGKKRVIKRKLYPGYIVVHMEINEDTWFLVRETPGIGDFTGASGVPSAMLPHEVERIIAKQEEKSEKAPDLKIPFAKGDRVKVIEGNFENFEGEVDAIDKTNGRVTVMITIFNRTTPVEFEYWQVESV